MLRRSFPTSRGDHIRGLGLADALRSRTADRDRTWRACYSSGAPPRRLTRAKVCPEAGFPDVQNLRSSPLGRRAAAGGADLAGVAADGRPWRLCPRDPGGPQHAEVPRPPRRLAAAAPRQGAARVAPRRDARRRGRGAHPARHRLLRAGHLPPRRLAAARRASPRRRGRRGPTRRQAAEIRRTVELGRDGTRAPRPLGAGLGRAGRASRPAAPHAAVAPRGAPREGPRARSLGHGLGLSWRPRRRRAGDAPLVRRRAPRRARVLLSRRALLGRARARVRRDRGPPRAGAHPLRARAGEAGDARGDRRGRAQRERRSRRRRSSRIAAGAASTTTRARCCSPPPTSSSSRTTTTSPASSRAIRGSRSGDATR